LTLHQLKEIISEVYASKIKHDDKCLRFKNPMETMEQHIDTYLTTKFGLRPLVIDWTQAIYTGVSTHSDKDHDVMLFGKILQSDIDEDFRFVQEEVKATLKQCLKIEVRKQENKEYKLP
jgi:hypothetical protein